MGNGPSIKNVPLEKLAYPSFGVNKLKPDFKPTYYINLRREHVFRMEAGRDDYKWDVACIRNGVARCKERSFIWRGNIPLGLGNSKTHHMAVERTLMWSDSMDYVFLYGGMTHCASQVAVMLGFTELIMIGMDGNYRPFNKNIRDANHYSEDYWDGHNPSMSQTRADECNKNHAVMHKYIKRECAKRGVKVRYVDTRNYIS